LKKGMGKEPVPPEFLIVAHILAPWGIKGEIKVEVVTDFPERFTPGRKVYLNGSPLEIESCRQHKHHLLLKLATINSIEAAEKLKGHDLTVPSSELQALPEGQYYTFQLIGLKVVTTKGKLIGRLTDILTTVSNDVYVVKGKRGEILIPAIEDVVKSINLEKGKIVIEAIEGLLD
jgi:16S rRNA processing protein RimM